MTYQAPLCDELIMGKHILKFILVFIFLLPFFTASTQPLSKSSPINPGEVLEFKLGYGWFTLGYAEVTTAKNLVSYAEDSCYRVDIKGKTSGLAALAKVDDKFGGIVSTNGYKPYFAYRDLKEGSYRLKEKTFFDYDAMKVKVEAIKKDGKKQKNSYDLRQPMTFELISGLLYARSIDYKKLRKGDKIKIHSFFEDEFYDLKVIYYGVELVKTKVGKLNAYKLVPIMPDNSIFNGENSVTIWISADKNRLPLKADAAMFIGSAYVELINYQNIKYGVDFK